MNLEWLEVKMLIVASVWSPMLLCCCTPEQRHLVFYILAVCQFFPCSLIFNKSRNGSETTFREQSEHFAGYYSHLINQLASGRP